MLIEQIDGPEKSAPSLITAAPSALLWPAAMIVWGPGYVSDTHRHHSVQLVMAIEGRLLIRRDSRDQWMECGAALIKADAAHEVDASTARVLLVFVDPECDLGAALTDKVTKAITPIEDDTVARWREQLGDADSLTSASGVGRHGARGSRRMLPRFQRTAIPDRLRLNNARTNYHRIRASGSSTRTTS
jgi:hypothetical protein